MASTFAERLAQACDDSPLVPDMGQGRQMTLARRLGVSQEAVRKWFSESTVPRSGVMKELASFLEVEEAWLALGVAPEMDRSERRAHTQTTNGAVLLTMGAMELAGGRTAQPGPQDPRRSYVDFYAINHGTQFAVHVSMGREVSPNQFEFLIPREFKDVRMIGVVKLKNGSFRFLNLPVALVDQHKVRKAGQFALQINLVDNRYVSGNTVWPVIQNFEQLH